MATCDFEFLECPHELASAVRAAYDDAAGGQDNGGPAVRVVVTLDLVHRRLREFRSEKVPVLLVGLLGRKVTIGPIQIPSRSVCLACFWHWAVTSRHSRAGGDASSSGAIRIAAALASRAIAEYRVSGRVERLENALIEVDSAGEERSIHPIFPLRSCVHCSGHESGREIDLRVHVSPLTGMVNHLECTPDPVAGIYHALSVSVNPIPVRGMAKIPRLQNAFGSGMSRQEAENRCIGEAIEGYSLVHRGNEPLRRAPLEEPSAIDPRRILLFSERQYEDRGVRNRANFDRYFIPERFEREREVDWTPGLDLGDGSVRWVPAACCLTWYRFKADEPVFAVANASACGSGRSVADALASALLEAIERDAVAIWWYNRVPRPQVSLESFDDPAVLQIRDGLRQVGRGIVLLDVTTDFGIPAYVAVTARNGGQEPVLGTAAHPSPRAAACRAVTEAAQNWYITQRHPVNPEIQRWMTGATVEQYDYLQPAGDGEAPQSPPEMDAAARALCCIRVLGQAGLHPVMVNLSRPDTLLHTVRVIVPGLRQLSNRYAPGRLYDVPVQLGWRKTPLREPDLNPVDCPF